MSKLDDLLAQYWDAAYREGEQCRIYDTEDGLAQSLLMQIKDEFNAAFRAGQEDMRERAAKEVESFIGWASDHNLECRGDDIRALEIRGE